MSKVLKAINTCRYCGDQVTADNVEILVINKMGYVFHATCLTRFVYVMETFLLKETEELPT